MRLDHAECDQDHQESEQPHRQADAPGERPQGTARVALVVDEVEKAGPKTGHDADENENDDYLDPHDVKFLFCGRGSIAVGRCMKIPPIRLGPYRFAPGFWPSVAFALVFPLLLGLGLWQTERAGAKQELLDRRAASDAVAPLWLGREARLAESDRYRAAEVRGRYSAGQQWLLDNRIFRGQAGYHVFTPFILEGEQRPRLLVNRGWVAVGPSRDFLPLLPLPEGTVNLSGRLDRPASVGLILGEVPLQSVDDKVLLQALDLASLGAARGLDLLPFALVIDEGQAGALQYDWSPVPEMGPEKHLGYAVQWFGLAVALLIIYVGVNTRRDGGDGENRVQA